MVSDTAEFVGGACAQILVTFFVAAVLSDLLSLTDSAVGLRLRLLRMHQALTTLDDTAGAIMLRLRRNQRVSDWRRLPRASCRLSSVGPWLLQAQAAPVVLLRIALLVFALSHFIKMLDVLTWKCTVQEIRI